MKITLSNKIKIILVSVCIIFGFTLTSCCSSEYIWVKVQKSELMPDSCELNRDSLIVGGMKICKIAQRYYYKPAHMGGGGLSFIGFTIHPHLVKTEYGEYTAMVKPGEVIVTGTGISLGVDEVNPMKVTFIATKSGISAVILN